MYGPRVNLNGASRESLLAQHMSVRDCADQLMNALRAAAPHGRDYQTDPNPEFSYRNDRDAWDNHLTAVLAIWKDYDRIAVRIATEDDGYKPRVKP
jgi:sugar/nucleoside kinase (ribokinase family)